MDLGREAPAAAGGAHVSEGTMETFERDVLDASMATPVIVDFWAEWCGPCRQLTPVLEKVVNAAGGKVKLVKIDIDKNKMLATQMRIQSVPTVYAFHQGRPVDGFQGALPESQVKAFIARLTDAAGPAPGEIDFKAVIAAADEALGAGDIAAAAQAYADVAQAKEEDADEIFLQAVAGLAKCRLAAGDAAGAREVLALAPEAKKDDPAFASVKAQLDLAEAGGAGDIAELKAKAAANPGDLAARLELAEVYAAKGAMGDAIDELLSMIETDRAWNEEAARKKLLQIFDALGATHAETLRGRRRLSSVLFS